MKTQIEIKNGYKAELAIAGDYYKLTKNGKPSIKIQPMKIATMKKRQSHSLNS